MMKQIALLTITTLLFNCKNETLPKPKAYLRLQYPNAVYKKVITPLPFSFEKNELAKPITSIKTINKSKYIDIQYPLIKATIYLTYKKVENKNLDSLILNTQNLTQKHTIKADEIASTSYENEISKVYGMLYEIAGNAASQSQFYLTDSTNHFLSGSLYFYAKPNYDSIYPASEYLKKDIKHIIESLHWKN